MYQPQNEIEQQAFEAILAEAREDLRNGRNLDPYCRFDHNRITLNHYYHIVAKRKLPVHVVAETLLETRSNYIEAQRELALESVSENMRAFGLGVVVVGAIVLGFLYTKADLAHKPLTAADWSPEPRYARYRYYEGGEVHYSKPAVAREIEAGFADFYLRHEPEDLEQTPVIVYQGTSDWKP